MNELNNPQLPQPSAPNNPVNEKQTDMEMLIQLVHPLIPAVQEYLAGERKDKETDQMSVQFDYQLRSKELDYTRTEQSEARQERIEEHKQARLERHQLRLLALIASGIIGVVLLVAVWKGQNAAALEIIKLLAGILGPAFGAYWYGKAKRDEQKRERPAEPNDDDEQ